MPQAAHQLLGCGRGLRPRVRGQFGGRVYFAVVASECLRRPSLGCIGSVLAIQFDPSQQLQRSINLATPDFLVLSGMAEGTMSLSLSIGLIEKTSLRMERLSCRGRIHRAKLKKERRKCESEAVANQSLD
jgi:hypothetical protein